MNDSGFTGLDRRTQMVLEEIRKAQREVQQMVWSHVQEAMVKENAKEKKNDQATVEVEEEEEKVLDANKVIPKVAMQHDDNDKNAQKSNEELESIRNESQMAREEAKLARDAAVKVSKDIQDIKSSFAQWEEKLEKLLLDKKQKENNDNNNSNNNSKPATISAPSNNKVLDELQLVKEENEKHQQEKMKLEKEMLNQTQHMKDMQKTMKDLENKLEKLENETKLVDDFENLLSDDSETDIVHKTFSTSFRGGSSTSSKDSIIKESGVVIGDDDLDVAM